jgi:hypothetical protein
MEPDVTARPTRAILQATALLAVSSLAFAGVASATPRPSSSRWDNCTAYTSHYPHGVGTKHAQDSTSGTPVTSFKHSNRLYNIAMTHNSDLDRDRDHIACERA